MQWYTASPSSDLILIRAALMPDKKSDNASYVYPFLTCPFLSRSMTKRLLFDEFIIKEQTIDLIF